MPSVCLLYAEEEDHIGYIMSAIQVLLSSLLIGSALSAESFWGRCPTPPAMTDFDMEKFEGFWYVMESYDPGERCMTWNITKGDSPNSWTITEEKENGAFHTVGLSHSTFNIGTITQSDSSNPGKLRIYWPISGIAGDAAFTVDKTDYDNYAGIFECQNVGLFHRQSGVVLSRTSAMKVDLRQMARVLAPGIKVEYTQRVFQGNCKYNQNEQNNADTVNSDSDGEPFGESGLFGEH